MRVPGTPRLFKRLVPRGLLGRSLLILIVPLVILQVVTAIIFFDRHWDTVMRRLAGGIAGDIATVLDLMSRFPETRDRVWIFEMAHRHMDLDITLEPGAILPNTARTLDGGRIQEVMAHSLAERIRRPFTLNTGILERELDIAVQLPEGVLRITAPRKRLFSSTTYIFVMWMVGTAMVLIGVAVLFVSKQVRSIRRLAAGADGFGKGREVPPIKPEGAREVRQAAHAFNVMRERIQRQIAQRTEMLAGVSHDLRTPITRMKLQLAMMEETPEVRDLSEDVAEMERMVEGYLAFARGEGREPVEPVDVAALTESVTARFQRNGDRVQTVGTGDGPVTVPVRRNALERAVTNLVANAVRYAHTVRVSVRRAGSVVRICVEDDGPGVPEDKREEVFRAFTRLEPSRNPRTGGTGLGLTIARDIVRGHGGDVTLDSSPDLGGLRATIELPL